MAWRSSTSARRTTRQATVSMIATGRSEESTRTERSPGSGTASPSSSISTSRPAVVVFVPARASAVSSSRRRPGNAKPQRGRAAGSSCMGLILRPDRRWATLPAMEQNAVPAEPSGRASRPRPGPAPRPRPRLAPRRRPAGADRRSTGPRGARDPRRGRPRRGERPRRRRVARPRQPLHAGPLGKPGRPAHADEHARAGRHRARPVSLAPRRRPAPPGPGSLRGEPARRARG